ncbi:MAG: serine/threonine-protein kinase [Lachnospiraceae bacterium]
METPRVCLGCFSEWEEEKLECPHCGWNPEREYSDIFQWKTGAVFEQRYLLGELYVRTEDIAIWRMYDNLLGIACFVMRSLKDEKEKLFFLAQQLMKISHEEKEGRCGKKTLEILSLKKIDNRDVLVFSLEDKFLSSEKFEQDFLKDGNQDASEDAFKIPDRDRSDVCEQKKQVLRPDTLLEDRYRILDCIGIGGFGITYLCEDINLCREVAVKEYFPAEWVERDEQYVAVKQSGMVEAYRFGMQSFLKECRITAKFIHVPHLITIYDVLQTNDTAYLVMEYIEGISIGRELRMKEYKPYTPKEVSEILFPVLDALDAIHEKRIVHSDISPGNIMRAKSGEIVLIDMGAAKYNVESQPVLSAAFLKIDYAAPEQYRTAKEGIPKDEGPWTDIYAVGATMYYLLTGHKPTDVISRLNGKDIKLVSPWKYRVKLSGKWMKLIRRAMELEWKERISSAQELKKEMEKLL